MRPRSSRRASSLSTSKGIGLEPSLSRYCGRADAHGSRPAQEAGAAAAVTAAGPWRRRGRRCGDLGDHAAGAVDHQRGGALGEDGGVGGRQGGRSRRRARGTSAASAPSTTRTEGVAQSDLVAAAPAAAAAVGDVVAGQVVGQAHHGAGVVAAGRGQEVGPGSRAGRPRRGVISGGALCGLTFSGTISR